MKITNNSNIIQKNMQSSKIDKKNILHSSSRSVDSASNDTISLSRKNIQTINTIGVLQQEHARSQQLFGSLTLLSDAIQLFQEKPSAFKEHLETVLHDIQKEYPQIQTKIEKNISIPHDLSKIVDQLKKEVSTQMNSQKKEITYYLIQEQNKDAVAKKSINSEQIHQINQQVAKNDYNNLHKTNLQKITTILN